MEQHKSPKMWRRMMKSLQCWRVWSDWSTLPHINTDQFPLVSCSFWFSQLQRDERNGDWKRSYWKQPEKETSPLCLTWSASDLILCANLYYSCCLLNCWKNTVDIIFFSRFYMFVRPASNNPTCICLIHLDRPMTISRWKPLVPKSQYEPLLFLYR